MQRSKQGTLSYTTTIKDFREWLQAMKSLFGSTPIKHWIHKDNDWPYGQGGLT